MSDKQEKEPMYLIYESELQAALIGIAEDDEDQRAIAWFDKIHNRTHNPALEITSDEVGDIVDQAVEVAKAQATAAENNRILDMVWYRMGAYFDGDPSVDTVYVNVADLATEIESLRLAPPEPKECETK
jgi:hypothetical protein